MHQVGSEPAHLACWHGTAQVMPNAHRHDDVELNLCQDGELTYLFGGQRFVVPAGTVVLFWAAQPHQLIAATDGATTQWLTVPLPQALRWQLPDPFVTGLLTGQLMRVAPSAARTIDALLFAEWEADLAAGPPVPGSCVLLEVQARVQRLATAAVPATNSDLETEHHDVVHAARMASHVISHFTEPLTTAAIADHAGLSLSHAMTVFRRVLGLTMLEYLVRCRVTESQRLLISTTLPVATVGLAAGFGSQSQFYTAFVRALGVPPAQYRRHLRQDRQPMPKPGPGRSGQARVGRASSISSTGMPLRTG